MASFAIHSVGAVVIPINTRFKGDEAAYVLEAAGAHRLFTVTDFLDTDYVALLQQASTPVDLDEIVILRGTVPDGCYALRVNGNPRPFYFLWLKHDELPDVPIYYPEKENGIAIASIVSCAGDWFEYSRTVTVRAADDPRVAANKKRS